MISTIVDDIRFAYEGTDIISCLPAGKVYHTAFAVYHIDQRRYIIYFSAFQRVKRHVRKQIARSIV